LAPERPAGFGARAATPLSGEASESGTAVPRSKTPGAPGGRAICRRPSFASLVPACHFDGHRAIMAHLGRKRKPSIGFWARFFLEGLDRRWWLQIKDLQREKSEKTVKTRKKV